MLGNELGLSMKEWVDRSIPTVIIEKCPRNIQALREFQIGLSQEQNDLFQLYPLDFLKADIDQLFQTILISPQTLQQAETELSLLAILRNVLKHMSAQSSLFIEVNNLDFFENAWNFRDGNWAYLSRELTQMPDCRVWERTSPGVKESQTLFEYAICDANQNYALYRSTLHLFNVDQWIKLFEVAGFLVEECLGSWTGQGVSSQSAQLIFHLKSDGKNLPLRRKKL